MRAGQTVQRLGYMRIILDAWNKRITSDAEAEKEAILK
jgi:hypothetical protein